MARLFFQYSELYRGFVRSSFLILLVKSRLLLVGSALLLQLGVVVVTEISSGNMVAVPIRINISESTSSLGFAKSLTRKRWP